MLFPHPIQPRTRRELRLGIKSSLPSVKSALALYLLVYAANNFGDEVIYTEEFTLDNNTRVRISDSQYRKLEIILSDYLPANRHDDQLRELINSNPLYQSQIESLRVALADLYFLGDINFLQGGRQEREGGNRFNKKLMYSSNVDYLRLILSNSLDGLSPDALKLLLNWIGYVEVDVNLDLEKRLVYALTLLTENTVYRLRTSGGVVTFDQVGIYTHMIEDADIKISLKDNRETTGPTRILYSLLREGLNNFIDLPDNENECKLKSGIVQREIRKYNNRVKMMLSLFTRNLDAILEIQPEQQNEITRVPETCKNQIVFGAPGTGKSHHLMQKLAGVLEERKERVTFHPEYDNHSFVGGYKPITESIDGDDKICYRFVPQIFTNIYVKAWKDLDNDYYLVIEELNRGNCAEIFGELFQLLDRDSNYKITPSKEMLDYLIEAFGEDDHLGIRDGKIHLPPNLTILATMNTSDQSLFPIDSAFKRRWSWEYIPICYDAQYEDGVTENESYHYNVVFEDGSSFKWVDFIRNVNIQIKTNPNLGMDKCLGSYFVKAVENKIGIHEFINKVIFYLWNDVFKDEENNVFPKDVSYQDFFPIISNGVENVKKILENLEIVPTPAPTQE